MEQSSFESQSRGCAKTPILTVKQPGTTTPVYRYQTSAANLYCILRAFLFVCRDAMLPLPGVTFLLCFILFCFVLFCFVLFCFVLFCLVLFCFVLFCFVCFVFVSLLSLNPRPFVQSFFHIHRRYSIIVGDTVGKVRQAGAHQLIHGNAQAAPVTGSTLRSTPTDSRQ